jgi:6-phosphogluconolactonase
MQSIRRSQMRLLKRLSVYTTLLTVMAAVAGAGAADANAANVVGHVYVNDNTATTNTIAAFDRHADGTLTPTPGSPFATDGAGTGSLTGSEGSLQVARQGHYLLAVDAGSNQISVLAIRPDGGLVSVPGGTLASGGVEPVSIAVHGDLVYVANAGSGDDNYTGFRLGRHGLLHPLAGSTFTMPAGSQPGDVLFNRDGTRLVGTRVATSEIDSFTVGSDGLLTAGPGSPYGAQGPGPFGSEFSPTVSNQLFVSNAHGGAGNGTVSAFSVSDNGSLTSIGASPFADLQTAPCWVEISHDGRYLFAVNTAVPSISRYAIAPDGTLALIGSTPFKSGTMAPVDARLSPDGATLWVVDGKSDAVSGFAVHNGDLTELPSSPSSLPAGATPFGIVVN